MVVVVGFFPLRILLHERLRQVDYVLTTVVLIHRLLVILSCRLDDRRFSFQVFSDLFIFT